jgi:hypothetical protein
MNGTTRPHATTAARIQFPFGGGSARDSNETRGWQTNRTYNYNDSSSDATTSQLFHHAPNTISETHSLVTSSSFKDHDFTGGALYIRRGSIAQY